MSADFIDALKKFDHLTDVPGAGSSTTRSTRETSQDLRAGVPGGVFVGIFLVLVLSPNWPIVSYKRK